MNAKMIPLLVLLVVLPATSLFAQEPLQHERSTIDFTETELRERLAPGARHTEGFTLQADDETRYSYTGRIEVPLSEVSPLLGVGNIWEAGRTAPGAVQLEIRGSADGSGWTQWYEAGHDEHIPAEEGRHSGRLVFFDQDIRHIEYRIAISEDWDDALVLRSIDFSFISPGATRPQVQQEIRSTRERSRPVDVLTESLFEPDYVDRETWGEGLDISNTNDSRRPMEASHLVVHHSAFEHDPDDWAAVVRTIYGWHTNKPNNWSDIGYQWLVAADGSKFQGRAFHSEEEQDVIGAHVGGQNTEALGFCVIGDFHGDDNFPTDEALDGLYNLLAWRADLSNIDVLESSTKTGMHEETQHIGGHRDYDSTACPGDHLYAELDMVREGTAELLDAVEEYHIPLAGHDQGFESLAKAFQHFNTADPEASSRVIIHEDLREDASELTLSADLDEKFFEIIFTPADETDVTISISGSDESGIELNDTRYITFRGESANGSLTVSGEAGPENLFRISGGSDFITLEDLTLESEEADNELTGISFTGAEENESIHISGNTFGRPEAPLQTGLHITGGNSRISLGSNEFYFNDTGIGVFDSEDFEIADQQLTGSAGNHFESHTAALRIADSDGLSVYRNDIEMQATDIPSAGIRVNTPAEYSPDIYNNIIRITPCEEGNNHEPAYGLLEGGEQISSARFIYNTVYIGASEHFGPTAAFAVSDGVKDEIPETLFVRNNLLLNYSEADEAFAVSLPDALFPSNPSGLLFDYNNYYAGADDASIARLGDNFTDDLAEWQDWTGQDASSSSVDVAFTSETELQLVDPSVGDLQLAGVPIEGITTDFFGNERNWTQPYMGAHEGDLPLTIVDAEEFYVGQEGTGPDGTNPNFRTLSEAFFILSDLEIEEAQSLYITSDIDDTTETAILENPGFSEEHPLNIAPAYEEAFEIRLADGVHLRNTSHVTFSGRADDSEADRLRLTLTEGGSGAGLFITEDVTHATVEELTITHETENAMYDGGGIQIRRDDAATVAPSEITIRNNRIGTKERHFSDGVRVWGTSGLPVTDVTVADNRIHAGYRGITTFVNDAIAFTGNRVNVSGLAESPGFYAGIYLAAVGDADIHRNEILMTGSDSSSPEYLAGININVNTGELNFHNNTIGYPEDHQAQSTTYNSAYGIAVHREGAEETYNFYHNTINIEDITANMEASAVGWEEDITSSSASFNFTNNIFRNMSDSDLAKVFQWDVDTEALSSDHNLWYGEDMDFAVAGDESFAALGDWSEYSGADASSRVDEVHFRSDRDLRLHDESVGQNTLGGTPLAEVTEDIDGNPRPTDSPYKGAFEGSQELVSSEEPLAERPESYELKQNYPNPFNPATTIEYVLPEAAQVELTVFSIDGRRVQTLINEQQQPGTHIIQFDASDLASGTYLYRIRTESFSETRKMMFVK